MGRFGFRKDANGESSSDTLMCVNIMFSLEHSLAQGISQHA